LRGSAPKPRQPPMRAPFDRISPRLHNHRHRFSRKDIR